MTLLIMVLLAGCKDAVPTTISSSSIPLDNFVVKPVQNPSPTPVVLDGFPMPLTEGTRLISYQEVGRDMLDY
ncbi:hypothetical protein D3C84_1247570 [compost metagenome]